MAESSFDDRLNEHGRFLEAIRDQTDLGLVLITGSYIDEQLLRIIQWYMVEGRLAKEMVSGPSAPLGSFSSRIGMAFALGLIDEQEEKSITAIRKIRNEFAHNISVRFEDDKVKGKFDALCWAIGSEKLGSYDPKHVFCLASQRITMQLLNRADHVRLERLKRRDWPHVRVDFDNDLDYDIRDYIY